MMHRAYAAPDDALVDALAFRFAALDIVRRSLRTSHQVMGAVGQCDEHDMAIITLAVQGRLRLPHDLEASLTALAEAAHRLGFDSIHTPVGTGAS
jgi:hypothetical protein